MTLLSENLRTIRKHHKCTQMAMAQVLGIGFRTYVRYEGGERDAPSSTLVQIAQLGSISLDRLLTTCLTAKDFEFPDTQTPPKVVKDPKIIGGSLSAGRLSLVGLREDIYICLDDKESEVLKKFRELPAQEKESSFQDGEWLIENRKKFDNKPDSSTRKNEKEKNLKQLKELAQLILPKPSKN